jgi:hypothetical protein
VPLCIRNLFRRGYHTSLSWTPHVPCTTHALHGYCIHTWDGLRSHGDGLTAYQVCIVHRCHFRKTWTFRKNFWSRYLYYPFGNKVVLYKLYHHRLQSHNFIGKYTINNFIFTYNKYLFIDYRSIKLAICKERFDNLHCSFDTFCLIFQLQFNVLKFVKDHSADLNEK